jgi:hypothetical protein
MVHEGWNDIAITLAPSYTGKPLQLVETEITILPP